VQGQRLLSRTSLLGIMVSRSFKGNRLYCRALSEEIQARIYRRLNRAPQGSRYNMSESLSEDEVAELIRYGRINTSRSAAKRRQAKLRGSTNSNAKTEASAPRARDSPGEVDLSTSSKKELDPEWLMAEKAKAERNIAAHRQNKQHRDEMQEASRF
jgi:hypothetical protein